MNKILVTAFVPFYSHKTNTSKLVLDNLIERNNTIKLTLPVSYDNSIIVLKEYYERYKTDIILSLGLASSSNYIRIENRAINLQDSNILDNNNVKRINTKIIENCSKFLDTFLDTKNILKIMKNDYIDVVNSYDAGKFVCNTIYYYSLYLNNKKSLFIHLPNNNIEISDGYDIEKLTNIIEKLINYLSSV